MRLYVAMAGSFTVLSTKRLFFPIDVGGGCGLSWFCCEIYYYLLW